MSTTEAWLGSDGAVELGSQTTAYLLGGIGAALAVGLSAIGAAIGTAKAAQGLQALREGGSLAVGMIPVIMSGVVALYGLILAVLMKGQMGGAAYLTAKGAFHLAAGLAVGLPCLGAGWAIGSIAHRWMEGAGREGEPLNTVRFILVLIFAESIGLYGLIVGLLLAHTDV